MTVYHIGRFRIASGQSDSWKVSNKETEEEWPYADLKSCMYALFNWGLVIEGKFDKAYAEKWLAIINSAIDEEQLTLRPVPEVRLSTLTRRLDKLSTLTRRLDKLAPPPKRKRRKK